MTPRKVKTMPSNPQSKSKAKPVSYIFTALADIFASIGALLGIIGIIYGAMEFRDILIPAIGLFFGSVSLGVLCEISKSLKKE